MRFVITSRVTPLFLSRFNDQSIGHTFPAPSPPLSRPDFLNELDACYFIPGYKSFRFMRRFVHVLFLDPCPINGKLFRIKIYRFSSHAEDDKNFGNNPALLQWLGRDWRESRSYNGIMTDGMETIILIIFNCQFARRNYYGMQDRML